MASYSLKYSIPYCITTLQGHRFLCHLKATMRLPISDQQQPRAYLAPQYIRDGDTDG